MNKFIAFMLLSNLLSLSTTAQELAEGQELPKSTFQNVFNNKSDSLSLHDFEGKLLILDFWGIHCSACLKAFPKINSLQKQFNGQVQFIMVNSESLQQTTDFFEKHRNIKIPKDVPFICADTLLESYFPHSGRPYHAWISPNGTVQYRFEGYYTTELRIKEFLAGTRQFQAFSPSKKTYVRSFIDSQYLSYAKYFSYITTSVPGYHLEASDKIPGFVQVSTNSFSVIELIKWSYYKDHIRLNFNRPGRLILRLKDTFPFVRLDNSDPRYYEWSSKYLYNYHLYWPEARESELYEIMKNDLERFFPLTAHLGINKTNAWVLVQKGNPNKLRSRGGQSVNNFFISDFTTTKFDSVRQLRNVPFKDLASSIESIVEYHFKMPFADSTNYSGNIDFQMTGYELDHLTIYKLRKALNEYGLDLELQSCSIPALIIEDKRELTNKANSPIMK